MPLTGTVPKHPAQYSPEILDVLRELIEPGEHVHDPFGGRGERLGALCDELGATFTGTDIEQCPGADDRVRLGNSRHASTYPSTPFTVITSPVYLANRISSDYVGGPTPTTKTAGRRSYGISLGQALDEGNLARVCRPSQEDDYYALHAECVRHWGDRALVNVDGPLGPRWEAVLTVAGFEIAQCIRVETRRYRVGNGENAARAPFEVVIEAVR